MDNKNEKKNDTDKNPGIPDPGIPDIYVKQLNKVKTLMDDNNKKALEIYNTKGYEEAVKHMLIHPETGKPMDYATMRYYYG